MDKYWSYEELEYEKYYIYFTPEEWQKFLTYKSQLDAFHPQKIFEQKKRNLIRSYEDFLSPDIVGQLSRQIFMPFIMNLVNVCSAHEHTIPFIA